MASFRVRLLFILSQALIALAIIGLSLNSTLDKDHVFLGRNIQPVFKPVPSNASLTYPSANTTEISRRLTHTRINESINHVNETVTGQNVTQPTSKYQTTHNYNFTRWLMDMGLNGSLNGITATDIRNKIGANLSRCHAMQIVRPEVPDDKIVMHFVNKSKHGQDALNKLIERDNQSDCVPMQENCAIVGNSGILSGSKCGDVINSYQYVIRFNLALLGERFEEDVGSRTDVMTMNHAQMDLLAACSGTLSKRRARKTQCNALLTGFNIFKKENRVLWFFKDCLFLNNVTKALAIQRQKNDMDFRFAYSPGSPMVAATKFLNVRVASSGFAAYVAATQFCKNLSLFGFYPFNTAAERSILNHYYDKPPPKTSLKSKTTRRKRRPQFSPHDMPMEYKFLNDLADNGAFRIINNCNGKIS